MGEEKRELSGMVILALSAVLFWFFDSVMYFMAVGPGTELLILYGILELVFALYVFLGLALWDLIPIKVPFYWWLLVILGAVTLIFGYLGSFMSYWAGTLAIMAGLVEFFGGKKGWKANKMMALLGAALGIYECILLFYALSFGWDTDYFLAGLFGLILCIILIILIFDFVDIKIPYEWWVLLIIGFMFFAWISLYSASVAFALGIPLVNYWGSWGGQVLLIAFILRLLDF
ncbi:MAG: hypothetical protein ACFE9X_02580 [Promethearchaeota archaeon]